MEFDVTFKVSDKIFLKDPEKSELGSKIVSKAIDLVYELGFEAFTFKKLAAEIKTTEASIYRYFENKHRLLLYILNWYWSYLEFLVEYKIQNITGPKEKLEAIVLLLTHQLPDTMGRQGYNKKYLNEIVIAESSKAYLVKDVNEINKEQVYKPYKDLCGKIATLITAYKPGYKYPHSLSSTLIEASHQQQFFCLHLPKLTDGTAQNTHTFAHNFLGDLLFKVLDGE